MNAIYGYLIAGVTMIVGIIGVYLRGRSKGKAAEKVKDDARIAEAQRQANAKVTIANDVTTDINKLDAAAIDKQLRDKYTRDH